MGSFIEKFLDFRQKPRDAAVGGHPLTQQSQLVLFWRNRTTQSTGVRVIAKVYMPWSDTTETRIAIGPVSSSGTTFTAETAQLSGLGTFSNGELLVGVSVTADSITNPVQLWVSVALREKTNSAITIPLCNGYTHGSNIVGWTAGSATGTQSAALATDRDYAQFSLILDIENGAMNSGNHVVAVSSGTGGRFRPHRGRITNDDGAARSATLAVDDGGTPTDYAFTTVSLNAGTNLQFPYVGGIPAAGGNNADREAANGWIAGTNRLRMAVAAVAVSEDTGYALTADLIGPTPSATVTAPCGAVTTSIVARVEAG